MEDLEVPRIHEIVWKTTPTGTKFVPAGTNWNKITGTRSKLEQTGTRSWNKALAGTKIAGTRLSRIPDSAVSAYPVPVLACSANTYRRTSDR